MRAFVSVLALLGASSIVASAIAAPPDGKGGNKGGNDGGGDPPADFIPAIAYFDDGRQFKDIRLANRAGDQACLVLRSDQGGLELRGFAFSATTQKLAYSVDGTGIYVASWTDTPCQVSTAGNLTDPASRVAQIPANSYPEFIDFSPEGQRLVWTQSSSFPDAQDILIYNLAMPNTQPVSLPLQDWTVFGVRFSPDFDQSNEVIFVGGNRDGSTGTAYSLFAYDISAVVEDGVNPRQIFNASAAGAYLGPFVTVTNPQSPGDARIAVTDNDSGRILQFSLDGIPQGNSFAGYEPAYSCDNSEIIHTSKPGRKQETYITSASGTASVQWSNSGLRWLDWLCP